MNICTVGELFKPARIGFLSNKVGELGRLIAKAMSRPPIVGCSGEFGSFHENSGNIKTAAEK